MARKSYRLRTGVRFDRQGGKCFLVSGFPLKALSISCQWAPVFDRLKNHSEINPDEIPSHTGLDIPTDGLQGFFSELEKRGFLEETNPGREDDWPSVSIVIPIRNRPLDIHRCLSSLAAIHYHSMLEIIVVDDASTDETAVVVRRHKVMLHAMERRRGASFCRNYGAAQATGEILCFLDSDCTVDSRWLEEMVTVFKNPRVRGCGGFVDSQLVNTRLDRYEAVKSSLIMGRTNQDSDHGGRYFYVPSCNMAVHRKTFQALGGFREDLEVGEDVDLCWRIMDQGWVIEYRPSAVAYHRHRNKLLSFCCRRFDYGTSESLLQSLHPSRRKTFVIRPKAVVFWTLMAIGTLPGLLWSVGLALAWMIADAQGRRKKAAQIGLTLRNMEVWKAAIRSNLSFVYLLSAFFSRYYMLLILPIAVFLPAIGAILVAMHIAVGMVQYAISRPRIDPISFLFYFTFEQLSYQLGVYWGCWKQDFFLPLFPRLSFLSGPEGIP